MNIIGLLVALIVICLLWWAMTRILAAFGVGNPIATVVQVIFVVLVIFWILSVAGVGVPGLNLRS